MKRSPLSRGTVQLKRSPMSRGKGIARGRTKRTGPSSAGRRFNAWACAETRERAGNRCERCGVSGDLVRLECAHLVGLQCGGNRFDPLDPRNHPPLRRMLCAPFMGQPGGDCHRGLDVLHTWTPADQGWDVGALFEEARESVWKHAGRFEEKATRARPTPRRRVA